MLWRVRYPRTTDLLTQNDYERSQTSHNLEQVVAHVDDLIRGRQVRSHLDVGCGYGGVAATLSQRLALAESHGIDLDHRVIDEARQKGVRAVQHDLAAHPLPYPDESFDLVTCFGVLDYFPYFDDPIAEFSRVLRPNGLVVVTSPNLASWNNRLALLMGYQPRDVEVARRCVPGVAPYYRGASPVGHIHTSTTTAFRQLMSTMGFEEARTVGLRPANLLVPVPSLVRSIDAVIGRHRNLARRFLYAGWRVRYPTPEADEGWWASRD